MEQGNEVFEMLKKRVGEKLTLLRERKGLTQEEVAKATKCGLRNFTRWENGETLPVGKSLQKLADFYQTKPDRILK